MTWNDGTTAGARRVGWFLVGLLGGIPGTFVASLVNIGHPDRSTATGMALIGLGTGAALFLIRAWASGTLGDLLLLAAFLVLGTLGIA